MTRTNVLFVSSAWLGVEDGEPGAARAGDKWRAEAERLTDSSCTRRWEASAGFTLLAFACLQPA